MLNVTREAPAISGPAVQGCVKSVTGAEGSGFGAMMNPPLIALFDCREGNVRQKRRDHSTYAKGNFRFERVVTGWRTQTVLDLRLKE
jgi:hypothetical protein